MTTLLEFDSARDMDFANQDPAYDHVLHLFHAHWHGIRSACACLPGHKLAIAHEGELDGEFIRHVFGLIFKHRIKSICIQGVSENALKLAGLLRTEFGGALVMVGVTHVNPAQFEYGFEIDMQRLALQALRRGVLNRLASVKPHFNEVVEDYWPELIYNCAPNISAFALAAMPDLRAVFVPVENTWRKNLFTNILAACRSDDVDTVFAVNHPGRLGDIADLSKLRLVRYLRAMNFYSFLATVGCVLNASLAECQPMTQLEAMAIGTPCITGPLGLAGLARHPLTKLTEVGVLDTPVEIRRAMETILRERSRDETGFQELLRDYTKQRLQLCLGSYARLLDIARA